MPKVNKTFKIKFSHGMHSQVLEFDFLCYKLYDLIKKLDSVYFRFKIKSIKGVLNGTEIDIKILKDFSTCGNLEIVERIIKESKITNKFI